MRLLTSRTFWLALLVWTLLCGAIFLVARQLQGPVPSAGFGHREAEALALAALIGEDSDTYGDYIVINSASSAIGSTTGLERWIVLCNRSTGATAESAIVVEIDRAGLEVLGFRRPGQRDLESEP